MSKKADTSSLPSCRKHARGLNTKKKQKICDLLLPLMPAQNRAFWNELPTSDDAKDLLEKENA